MTREQRIAKRTREIVGDGDGRYIDAIRRYARAHALVEQIRDEWEAAGSPLLAQGQKGAPIAHPLVTLLQVAERDAARIGSSLGLDPAGNARTVKRPAGGQLGAARAPDRQPVPRLSPLPPRLAPLTPDDLRGTGGNSN